MSRAVGRAAGGERSRRRTGCLILGIALLAVNLRPAVVAVAPLTSRIRAGTGLSSAGVSLLTTLPVLCFGLFALLAPRLGRRVGLQRALGVAIVALVAGSGLRLIAGTGPLFVGSALAGAGIAVMNVLLSGLIKREFPSRTGALMSVYTFGLSGGATAAAGLTVPLGDAFGLGWRATLGLWGIPALVAAVGWLGWLAVSAPRDGDHRADGATVTVGASGDRETPGATGVDEVAPSVGRIWRAPLAWWMATYMASQSLVFYSLNAWLPTLLQDHGVTPSTAGAMLAVFNFTGLLSALAVPPIAVRMRRQRGLGVAGAGLFAVGIVGLLVAAHGGAWVWMVLLGLAQGAGISLGLTLFVLRTRGAGAAAELSGMAQTVGYLIAALGPVSVGALHGATGGWTAGLLELLAVCVVLLVAAWVVGADRVLVA